METRKSKASITQGANLLLSFPEILRKELHAFRTQMGFDSSAVTRIIGEDLIVLNSDDDSCQQQQTYLLFSLIKTICWRMVLGQGPRVAPMVDAVPAYTDPTITQAGKNGAYVGAPLFRSDGGLFGTIYASNEYPKNVDIAATERHLSGFAQRLALLVEDEFQIVQLAREAQYEIFRERVDGKNLLPMDFWLQLCISEDELRSTLASPAGVIVAAIEKNEMLRVITCLRDIVGVEPPIVTDEHQLLGLIIPDCNSEQAMLIERHILDSFIAAKIAGRCIALSARFDRPLTGVGRQAMALLGVQCPFESVEK